LSKGIIAAVGGGACFGSQSGETESIDRWELKDEQENKNRRRKQLAGCFRKRFLGKDKDLPLV
jgi:hypothetical protein